MWEINPSLGLGPGLGLSLGLCLSLGPGLGLGLGLGLCLGLGGNHENDYKSQCRVCILGLVRILAMVYGLV